MKCDLLCIWWPCIDMVATLVSIPCWVIFSNLAPAGRYSGMDYSHSRAGHATDTCRLPILYLEQTDVCTNLPACFVVVLVHSCPYIPSSFSSIDELSWYFDAKVYVCRTISPSEVLLTWWVRLRTPTRFHVLTATRFCDSMRYSCRCESVDESCLSSSCA